MRQQTGYPALGDVLFLAAVLAVAVFFFWRLGMLG